MNAVSNGITIKTTIEFHYRLCVDGWFTTCGLRFTALVRGPEPVREENATEQSLASEETGKSQAKTPSFVGEKNVRDTTVEKRESARGLNVRGLEKNVYRRIFVSTLMGIKKKWKQSRGMSCRARPRSTNIYKYIYIYLFMRAV